MNINVLLLILITITESFSHCLTTGNHKKALLMLKSEEHVPNILP